MDSVESSRALVLLLALSILLTFTVRVPVREADRRSTSKGISSKACLLASQFLSLSLASAFQSMAAPSKIVNVWGFAAMPR